MLRLLLVCNASTDAHRRAAFPGDEPLDARGESDATALAAHLPRADRALTSPALRARRTAELLRLDATADNTLRDIDYAAWTGMTLEEMEARDAGGVAAWLTDPGATPHGGESVAALMARAQAFLLAQVETTGTTIAVTHPSVARACIVLALEAPAPSFWRVEAGPLARVTLTADRGRWRLRSILD